MQYNQSPLEKELKTPEQLPVNLPWRILFVSIIAFGIMVFIYLGMLFGYKPFLDSQIKKVDMEISSLSKEIGKEQLKELITFYSQLTNIQKLFDSRVLASNVFDFLEETTHQNVYFTLMNLSTQKREVRLEGLSPSYRVLAEQLELFRKNPQVGQVFLRSSNLEEGSINFMINLILKPGALLF